MELGGRRFKRLEGSTVKHDFWLMSQARSVGLDRIKIESRKPEVLEAALGDVIDRCIMSGKALILLAGLLLPEDMSPREWTPAVAEEIAEFLSLLTDPSDKNAIRPLVASMLSGFFMSGLASLQISPASSSETEAAEVEPDENDGDRTTGSGMFS